MKRKERIDYFKKRLAELGYNNEQIAAILAQGNVAGKKNDNQN